MRRYVYRIDIIEKFTFKKSYDKRFLSIRLTRLYFLTFQDYQFRQLFKLAGKMDGNLEENYIHFLEGRLLSIVYRMNFIFDIFECMRVIKEKYIYVNFVNKIQFNKCIKVGDFISIKSKYLDFIKFNCDIRSESEAFLFNIPQFLFVSYYFFFAFLLYKPRRKELVYPISLDIQRITGYY
jgi:ribosomal protein S4